MERLRSHPKVVDGTTGLFSNRYVLETLHRRVSATPTYSYATAWHNAFTKSR